MPYLVLSGEVLRAGSVEGRAGVSAQEPIDAEAMEVESEARRREVFTNHGRNQPSESRANRSLCQLASAFTCDETSERSWDM